MSTTPWPSNRAVLIVHGIGDATLDSLKLKELLVRRALGTASSQFAYYHYAYDKFNDWLVKKADLVDALKPALEKVLKENAGTAAEILAEFIMDVIWPIYVKDLRDIIQTGYIEKLQQMVDEGLESTNPPRHPRELKISIICHSLGCFHTYEVLHRLIAASHNMLTPAHGLTIHNVIQMASPVQLISTVASKLPPPHGLNCLEEGHPRTPAQDSLDGNGHPTVDPFVQNWISITGDNDPVGGHLFGHKIDWAYMDTTPAGSPPPQESLIDDQSIFNLKTFDDWKKLLAQILAGKNIGQHVNDPHSWDAYIANHTADLKRWLTA